MKKWLMVLGPLFIFLLISAIFLRGLSLKPRTLPSALLGKDLPSFNLPVLGKSEFISNKALPSGWFVLNVWASWCDACVEEQSFLLRLAREGVKLYGLNYKDDATDASEWLKTWGNPYQQVMQDQQGKLAIDLGVYGAPESFLVNPKGKIVYRHAGVLDETIWKEAFVPRINDAHS